MAISSWELLEVDKVMQEEVKALTPLRNQAYGKQNWASTLPWLPSLVFRLFLPAISRSTPFSLSHGMLPLRLVSFRFYTANVLNFLLR